MTAEAQVSDVVEEYLETIYRLQEKEGDGAKTNEIVRSMNVVPGTVTNTVERLEKEGLVTHEPYRGVRLTEKGRKIAVQVVRRHRLSERLLTDILHVDWGKAHDVACKIEHDIGDEEILASIEKALGNPKTCPHGNPIPTTEDKLGEYAKETEYAPLWALDPSGRAIVKMITDEDVEMLQYLMRLGIVPGVSVEVVKKESLHGLITIRVGGSTVQTINQEAASVVKVQIGSATRKEGKHQVAKVERIPSRILAYAEYEQ
jgi:DtxR family Mn-dependent transcriptional regulator